MMGEKIAHLLKVANWKLTPELYERFYNFSYELSQDGYNFDWNTIIDFFEDDDRELLERIGKEEVISELLVRGLLDGWVEKRLMS